MTNSLAKFVRSELLNLSGFQSLRTTSKVYHLKSKELILHHRDGFRKF